MTREVVLRLAVFVIVGMVICMPTHVRVNDTFAWFAYRFVWDIGSPRNDSFSSFAHTIQPATGILLGQVVIVVVIAVLLAATLPSRNALIGRS